MSIRKILFYGSFTGGGTERITFNLASALSDTGEYDVCVLNSRAISATFQISDKVRCLHIGDIRGEKQGLLSTIKAVRKFIKQYEFDIVVSVEALSGIVLIPATTGLNCKRIVWEHANYYQTQNSRWTRIVRKIWLRIASAYVVLTKRDKRNFESNEKPRCPVIQIFNPVSVPHDSEYDASSKRIISVGHLVPIKQFDMIPSIFSRIAPEHPDWTWHIYGEGPERKKIEAEISKYNLQGRVILEGACRDIDKEYAKAAFYVLTSRMEGLPTVLIEAQMHGLPAISFDIETGPDEIIENGLNGFLVHPYDATVMGSMIKTLITDIGLRNTMSRKSNIELDRFHKNTVVGQWCDLLRSII